MGQRRGVAGGSLGALVTVLALHACQKAPAPAANPVSTANTAPAAANVAANAVASPAAPVAAAESPDAVAAKAFLDGVYAHYKSNSTGSNWAPMDANVKEVFDADLAKLLVADTKALKGEVGEIDSDWLCDCQDWESLVATVTVTSATPTEAQAVAAIHDTQIKDDGPPRRDTFDLVKTPAGWRIHDMGTRDEPSLRAVLTKEIADMKASAGKPQSGTDGPP